MSEKSGWINGLSLVLGLIILVFVIVFIINSMNGKVSQDFTKILLNMFFGIIVLFGLFQFLHLTNTLDSDCANFKIKDEEKNDKIKFGSGGDDRSNCKSEFSPNPNDILGDFHILGSHNSCVTGGLEDGFVCKDQLKWVIESGIRYLDFEIYSIRGETVVSAGKDSKTIKSSYNHVKVDGEGGVFNTIYKKAFDSTHGNKPLFVQLRIKSDIKRVYQDLAKAITTQFKERILEPRYGFNCEKLVLSGKDYIENQPMEQFKDRIIIVVDDPSGIIKATPLYEFTNILFPNETIYRADKISSMGSADRLAKATKYKTQFSCILPTVEKQTKNFNYTVPVSMGFHALCINMWSQDSNSQQLVKNVFYKNGSIHSFSKRNKENRAERVVVKVASEALPGSNLPVEGQVKMFGVTEKYKSA